MSAGGVNSAGDRGGSGNIFPLPFTAQQVTEKMYQYLTATGELTDSIKVVIDAQSDHNMPGTQKYWLAVKYPAEWSKVNDLWWKISLPDFREKSERRFTAYRVAVVLDALRKIIPTALGGVGLIYCLRKETPILSEGSALLTANLTSAVKLAMPISDILTKELDLASRRMSRISVITRNVATGGVGLFLLFQAYRYWQKKKRDAI